MDIVRWIRHINMIWELVMHFSVFYRHTKSGTKNSIDEDCFGQFVQNVFDLRCWWWWGWKWVWGGLVQCMYDMVKPARFFSDGPGGLVQQVHYHEQPGYNIHRPLLGLIPTHPHYWLSIFGYITWDVYGFVTLVITWLFRRIIDTF